MREMSPFFAGMNDYKVRDEVTYKEAKNPSENYACLIPISFCNFFRQNGKVPSYIGSKGKKYDY